MVVLVVGSGGREHAIAWKLAREKNIDRILVAPGNGGTAGEPKCENVSLPGDIAGGEAQDFLADFARKVKAGLTIIGPEAPLAAGIVDRFREARLPVIGPDKAAARLETSKGYAKSFMEHYGVRTGRYRLFTRYDSALHYVKQHFKAPPSAAETRDTPAKDAPALIPPLVVKADGLAAGKGVTVAATPEEATEALSSFMKEGSLGEAGKTVLLEEFIGGREVSVLAAVSVSPGMPGVILPFLSARDHKRRFDGGKGPNTGGMGAIAPVPDFSPSLEQDFNARILKPTLKGMEQEGLDYRGFIFFGLMIRNERCFLLEYNVRLGDPETQAVLPLMDSNLGDMCLAVLENRLDAFQPAWKSGAVCAPVAVAGGLPGFPGYPGPYRKGDPITVDREKLAGTGALLFVAGAAAAPETPTGAMAPDGSAGAGKPALVTSGGRILAVSAWGADPALARKRAYEGLSAVSFEGMAYRADIGV
ncbi:MAG: phosphoribosylamine--glycine ligase [Spirochaetaceae bacterium]|jgi:phosphoribosylamine--glycine ligase|nr:phosphoribosylamine--glycine ligase [Spirochaetaceae bacterium]